MSKIQSDIDNFVQIALVQEVFPFVKITQKENGLEMTYNVKDSLFRNHYTFLIRYKYVPTEYGIPLFSPYLKLVSPELEIDINAHILSERKICYQYPGDLHYSKATSCRYAVDQSIKWCYGYEKYLTNGYKWPLAEMPHFVYPHSEGIIRPLLL